ncbi:hypothetical protein [Streptomyces sp. NPDC014791]|uniref:hypothetical protein n=1 Tax=Streptomyces sp. NPDC014791 TaxID=3364912 RepID=UPI0036FCA1B9
MANEDEGIAFTEEIDPALAKILAALRDYCESVPAEEALDLIGQCRMVVALYRDLRQLDDGAADQPGAGSLGPGGSTKNGGWIVRRTDEARHSCRRTRSATRPGGTGFCFAVWREAQLFLKPVDDAVRCADAPHGVALGSQHRFGERTVARVATRTQALASASERTARTRRPATGEGVERHTRSSP